MKKWMSFLVIFWGAAYGALAAPSWLTSVPAAQAEAKKEHKLVMLDFTGSDWCVWCQRLDADVFSKPEFDRYASTNLVLVQVDFPNRKPQPAALKSANAALQTQYGIDGFPTLVVLKPDGTVVWKQEGYLPGGVSAMIAQLDEAKKKGLQD
jgi:thiol:disulfide interchange protein